MSPLILKLTFNGDLLHRKKYEQVPDQKDDYNKKKIHMNLNPVSTEHPEFYECTFIFTIGYKIKLSLI